MGELRDYDSMLYRRFTSKSELDKALHTLEGILEGIDIDNYVNSNELKELRSWCDYHRGHKKKHPYQEILYIVQEALQDNVLDQEEIQDIIWASRKLRSSLYYNLVTSDMQKLQGILHGIFSDGVITGEELVGLQDWLDENTHLSKTYPYDELCSLITYVLKDGVLDDEEIKLLKVFFAEFIDINTTENIDINEIMALKSQYSIHGICSITPEIIVPDKTFCFTGISSRGKRHVIADTIESFGGLYKDTVSLKTNYLVVGDNNNPCWCFSCYGRKVEKAMNLRKNGHDIMIVHENDFWDALEDLK